MCGGLTMGKQIPDIYEIAELAKDLADFILNRKAHPDFTVKKQTDKIQNLLSALMKHEFQFVDNPEQAFAYVLNALTREVDLCTL